MKNFEGFIDTQSLALRHANLMQEKEQLPPGAEISLAKKKEVEKLEKNLRKILYKSLSSDVLPVQSTVAIGVIKLKEEKPLITFNFDIISELNTKVDRIKIEATTKDEAWEKAKKKAKKYPGNIHLKIS